MNKISDSSVLAIVVTYNGEPWIRKCLDTLRKGTLPPHVMVIDNGSKDQTISIIEEEFPDIIFIRSNENLGFGRANNLGIEYGVSNGFDFFFLLNQDAWVKPDTIELLVKAQQKAPQFGIVSPIHLNGEGTMFDYKFFDYIFESGQRKLISDLILRQGEDDIYPVNFINAAGWLLSAGCVKKVGGFDPLYRHYGEDDNYVHRLHFKKLEIGLVPRAIMFHDREARSRKDNKFDVTKEYRRLLLRYTDPRAEFSLGIFILEQLRLMYKALKSILRLKGEHFAGYIQLSGKFGSSLGLIKKSRNAYTNDYSFINYKQE